MVDQIRWINLYGEEVCKAKTHRKDKTKQIETMIPAMIQYGHLNGSKHDTVIQKGFVRGVPSTPGSVGLANLGNTCYLNAILQCMLQCPLLVNYFLRNEFMQHLNKSNPLGSGGRLASAFAEVRFHLEF